LMLPVLSRKEMRDLVFPMPLANSSWVIPR
jgi:hypothetical protein